MTRIACSCGIDEDFVSEHMLKNEPEVDSLDAVAEELLAVADLLADVTGEEYAS
jgi:hypothetical protein